MNKKPEIESLTRGCYLLKTSLEYFDDYKRDCSLSEKNKASLWSGKLKYVLSDVRSSLTEPARERFDEEITNSKDPIFLEAIGLKLLQLTQEQRELLELVADGLIRGEKIEFLPEPVTNP